MNAAGEGLERTLGGIESGESGQTAEGKIDFGDGAVGTEIFYAVGESGIELRGIDEIEKSALGVDAGRDGFSGNFFAVSKNNTSDSTVFDSDVADFSVGSDFDAGLFCGFS